MAGSVQELTRDLLAHYDEPCWSTRNGVLRDPVCLEGDALTQSTRGGTWAAGPTHMHAVLRKFAVVRPGDGLRCVYEVTP